ncbi:hypothetical protein DPEC_G00138070, partial [Dallia pectoralis]
MEIAALVLAFASGVGLISAAADHQNSQPAPVIDFFETASPGISQFIGGLTFNLSTAPSYRMPGQSPPPHPMCL